MRKVASQLDVLSIKRKITAINANVDESDAQVISKLNEVNTNVSNGFLNAAKSTKEVQVTFNTLSANSADFDGLFGAGDWAFPYVANKWHTVVDVTGKGEVNWISFASPRQVFTAVSGKLSKIKCTIDGVELFSKDTVFITQDAATAKEYVLLGVCIGTTRLIQNKLYFNESLLIEVYSEYATTPAPEPYINYQRY